MNDRETYDDFLRPGDANFTSFPKQLPEDTVSYSIHLVPVKPIPTSVHRSQLSSILQASTKLSKTLFKDYVWQREPFNLSFDESGTSHLEGTTCYGDSIADEWAIVYLLRELSRQFEDAWICVTDADGQFLLVEAANVLPKWLNPEVADCRVWVNAGRLKIVPRSLATPVKANPKTDVIDRDQALSFIKSGRDLLITSKQIEAAAFHRLRSYPAQIAESMHTARVCIPRKLAYVLHRIPAAISPAVEAFYLRDHVAMKPLQARSPLLVFPPDDLVTMSVKFTRVGYAQLKGQEFEAPEKWRDVRPTNVDDAAKEKDRLQTGMKTACGFGILLADSQTQDKRAVREISLLLDDLGNGDEALPTDGELATWPHVDDDEGWLDVNFEAFEQELAGRAGSANKKGQTHGAFGDQNAQDNLRRIVQQFEHFLDDEKAGPDGAEDDMDSDDETTDDEDVDSSVSGEDKEKSFSDADFQAAMKQMMGLPPSTTNRRDQITDAEIHEIESAGSGDEDEDNAIYESDDDSPSLGHGEDDPVSDAALEAAMKQMMGLPRSTRKRMKGLDQERALVPARPTVSSDNDSGDGDEITEIKRLMAGMEAELKEAGALDTGTIDDMPETDDARYQLAKNLLESFKGQAGQAGPAGNLMASMGVRMPRNEDG